MSSAGVGAIGRLSSVANNWSNQGALGIPVQQELDGPEHRDWGFCLGGLWALVGILTGGDQILVSGWRIR